MTSHLELIREEIASLENLWRKRQTFEGLAEQCMHGSRVNDDMRILKKIIRLKEDERQLLGRTSNSLERVPYRQWALCATDARLDYAIYLVDDNALAGRALECAIGIAAVPTVSRRHAVLTLQSGRLQLKDLRSTNGTRVNGWPVRRQYLSDGDRVVLADVEFIVISALIPKLLPPISSRPSRDWASRAEVIQGTGGKQGRFLAIAM